MLSFESHFTDCCSRLGHRHHIILFLDRNMQKERTIGREHLIDGCIKFTALDNQTRRYALALCNERIFGVEHRRP